MRKKTATHATSRKNATALSAQESTVSTTPLSEAFDPAELPPGTYVAQSGTEGYEFARLGEYAGLLDVVGEHDDADGGITLTFAPPGSRRVRRNQEGFSGAISLGPAYFQAPLREYQEWPVKWWREVLQNAVDAGSTRVELGTIKNEDGTVTAFCIDNGGGMSREVLFNKFLVMGGTTKEGGAPGTTGGFGKAKELILLPRLKWTVTSGNYVVQAPQGGAAWQAAETSNRFLGTRVEVLQPAGNHTTIEAAIEFLQRSWIPQTRFVLTHNGEPVAFKRSSMFDVTTATPVRSMPNMDIYFTPQPTKSYHAWIRINGLFMFSRYVESLPGQLVVELKGSSIENLTSNRDGFANNTIQRQLDAYLTEVAKDTTSALKAKKGLFKKRYATGQKASALPPVTLPRGGSAPLREGTSTRALTDIGIEEVMLQIQSGGLTLGRGGETVGTLSELTSLVSAFAAAPELLANLQASSDRGLESALKQLVWQPDFLLVNEVENLKIPAKFKPETMTVGVLRLAKMWTEICRWVLMQLGCGSEYAVGFIFEPDVGAAYLNEDNEHWLLLNPFALDPQMRTVLSRVGRGEATSATVDALEMFRVTDRADFRYLYALAVHECTHFANGINYHDESFASAMTQNFAICADGMGQYRNLLNATSSKRATTPERASKTPKAKVKGAAVRRAGWTVSKQPDLSPTMRVVYMVAIEALPLLFRQGLFGPRFQSAVDQIMAEAALAGRIEYGTVAEIYSQSSSDMPYAESALGTARWMLEDDTSDDYRLRYADETLQAILEDQKGLGERQHQIASRAVMDILDAARGFLGRDSDFGWRADRHLA